MSLTIKTKKQMRTAVFISCFVVFIIANTFNYFFDIIFFPPYTIQGFIATSITTLILSFFAFSFFFNQFLKYYQKHEEVEKLNKDIVDTNNQLVNLQKKLKKEAETDSLTGILNQRKFFSLLETKLSYYKNINNSLFIVIADVDFFKKINDNYGHLAGNQVLIDIAETLKKCVRKKDIAARIGGDEFCILLSGVKQDIALLIANRIKETISKTDFQYKNSVIKTTLSLGLTEIKKNEYDINAIYSKADSALYKAKANGRNRVEIAD